MLAPLQDAFATVHGLKMHYLRQGKGPVLVLLHAGLGSAEACWSPAALPLFAAQFDVIAPDQLGQGRTNDDPKHPMSYHVLAEDTVDLLAQLGVTNATFVGWSDGAILALDIAMHHPMLAKKIVASSANYDSTGIEPAVLPILKTIKPDDPMFKEWRDGYAKASPDGAGHWPVVFERMRKLWLGEPKWTRKELATIKTPALIMAGDHDMIRTAHTVELASAIPGAELAILPKADHEMPLTDSARWNAAVLAFLNEPPQRQANP